jgi:hypothetical protein
MKLISVLKQERQEKTSLVISECQMFFAFSNKQFEEGKPKLKEGDKYVHLGAGTYMPKSNVDKWIEKSKEIDKWYKSEVKKNKQEEQEILYELRNHEAFYTCDIEETFKSLEGYTLEQVREVYNKYKNK